MKRILMIIVCNLLLTAVVFAVTPPPAIQKAFEQKFPNASKIKWGKENKHEYEAEFILDRVKYSANYNDKGEWLETESAVSFDSLPEKVKSAFLGSYKGAKVKAAAKIENSKGETKYEIEFRLKSRTTEKFYKNDGTEIKG